MRSLFLRLFIAVLAVGIACNGMMVRAAFAAPGSGAHSAHMAFTNTVGTKAHSHSGHNGQHQSVDGSPVTSHDHADTGAKCCSMCLIVAHAMPDFSGSSVTFSYATVQFAVAKQTLAGSLVPLDPDIPKSFL